MELNTIRFFCVCSVQSFEIDEIISFNYAKSIEFSTQMLAIGLKLHCYWFYIQIIQKFNNPLRAIWLCVFEQLFMMMKQNSPVFFRIQWLVEFAIRHRPHIKHTDRCTCICIHISLRHTPIPTNAQPQIHTHTKRKRSIHIICKDLTTTHYIRYYHYDCYYYFASSFKCEIYSINLPIKCVICFLAPLRANRMSESSFKNMYMYNIEYAFHSKFCVCACIYTHTQSTK